MLFISPPFGNYLNLPNTISINGSFTLEERPGLIKQILKTLRYSQENNGWVNKIGLRNKGLDYAIKNHKENEICSIAIRNEKEIDKILEKIPENMNIELNISCPNVRKEKIENGLEKFINNERKWCIIKLSPLCDESRINEYYEMGFRQFHCSNTIPVSYGGLSGPSIKPYTFKLANYLTNNFNDIEIIGGGGIQTIEDINQYKNKGCNLYSVSSLLFNPIKSIGFFYDYYKINNI